MNSRCAPRAATWLLERVGGRSRFDPLIGDLVEQFEAGHSRLWYWRQSLGTLAIDIAQTLRLHAFSFIAAIAAGYALIWLLDAVYPYAFHSLHENLSASSAHPWTPQAVLRVSATVIAGLLANALIFVTVWVVTRIHRANPRTVLSVFATAVTARYVPGLARLAIHAATDPQFTASLVSQHLHLMTPVAWQALCILAAGLWVARRTGFSRADRLTQSVAISAASLCVLAAVARAAGLAGELAYTLREQYIVDVLNVASMAYLVFLLWRPSSVSHMTGQPSDAR
jgi:hypothetical protein